MYGSMRHIDVRYKNGDKDEYDILSYMDLTGKATPEKLMECHRHNVTTLASSLWRSLKPFDVAPKNQRVLPYTIPSDHRAHVIDVGTLFPNVYEPNIAKWWLNNIKKSKINYDNTLGVLCRRCCRFIPIICLGEATTELLQLVIQLSILSGYPNDKKMWTSFACHIDMSCLPGTSPRKKAQFLIDAIPSKYLRQRISVIGDNPAELYKFCSIVGVRATLDYDAYVKRTGKLRIDSKGCQQLSRLWAPSSGSSGVGYLITRETKQSRLAKLVRHFEKYRYNTLILDNIQER